MPNKSYFMLSVIILIVGLVSTIVFAMQNVPVRMFIGIAILLAGIILLIHWSTISYEWQCEECKTIVQLTMWENVKGLNVGVNRKYLFCPNCKKKVTFRGIKNTTK